MSDEATRLTAKEVFEYMSVWQPRTTPIPLEEIIEGMSECDRAFVEHAYRLAESFYKDLPPRKNGEPTFTHPTNVAMYLKMAHCQSHVIASGLLHDVLEDRVDLVREHTGQSADELELELRGEFASDVICSSTECSFPRDVAERVVEIVWTLTRHKADLYYKSISAVFTHPDLSIRIAAALVKLADRMHNIQTIENYESEEKLYQCFKNIFILNNAKQLLSEIKARDWDPRMILSIDRMFKKSGKAVFQALLSLSHTAHSDQDVFQVVSYLALALRKFMFEVNGLWRVTEGSLEPGSPVYSLYHGIVKKYDHRLHHEEPMFEAHVEKELVFMRATFESMDLDESELRTALSFKDAMALIEVVASLLYNDDYVIRGFECSRLCRRGRNCMLHNRGPV
jgi:hypothetical protein